MLDFSRDLLSNLTIYSKYSKYIPELNRRETWNEIIERNLDMHKKKYPFLSESIDFYGRYVKEKKILGAMRGYQFGGRAIERSPIRGFNCVFLPIDNIKSFSEIIFLLLSGCGVGYSVQFQDIANLPEIKKPKGSSRFLIGDSIEGWADAVRVLVKAYFEGSFYPDFDFSDIRPQGTPLKVSGGKAPGHLPLKQCLLHIDLLLSKFSVGDKIRPIHAHDIIGFIADAVLAGGIRRSACISLFSADDEEMRKCKEGNWYEKNPQRARANNSAVLLRYRLRKKDFEDLWKEMEENRSGEPGFILSNDRSMGNNPCQEASLRPFGACNLCEINGSDITTQEELNERARAAAFFGTLQAGYTDFHYLREIWRKTIEKDALLGVGITGLANKVLLGLHLEKAVLGVLEVNAHIAQKIGINSTARATLVKPSGTTSLVLGTSSGIHPWWDEYYIRRMRFTKNESIYQYLLATQPYLCEEDVRDPVNGIASFPIAAPNGAIIKESTIDFLERIKTVYREWVLPGHINGHNTHSISATAIVKDGEWGDVGKWMWENRDSYNALSVYPEDHGTYIQPPHESITEKEYNERVKLLQPIDFSKIVEYDDNTELRDNLACAGADSCEII